MTELLFGGADRTDATPEASGVFARVAVERGIDRIDDDGALTYRVAGESPRVGERVEVPLGKGGRAAPGIVVSVGGPEVLEGLDPRRVKAISRLTRTCLAAELVELARWMAEYYVCPLGMVLAAMMPAAVKHGAGVRSVEIVELVGARPAEMPRLKPAAKRAWEGIGALTNAAWPMPVRELAALVGAKGVRAIRELAAAGLVRTAMTEEIRAGVLPGFADRVEGGRADGFELTAEQRGVIGAIDSRPGFGVHLLRGVTGSGKTEVYLRLIERTMARGGGAIVLVPEIALTPQTSERFTTRFGHDRVAVLHSGLTPAQRNREWSRVASGAARVVVGARSAVFAPLEGLGLIVVDEEHDSSYKQDRLPRYNARDVAIKRAQGRGCPVVLGSATPSLESWANAASGKFVLHELRGRVGGAVLPNVEIVDLRDERRRRAAAWGDDGRVHLLGPTLESALEMTLREDGQAILLLNRRGLAAYVWCRNASCKYVLSCDQCDANLVVHRAKDVPAGSIVRCHHCDAAQRVPTLCPSCGGRLALFGWGTQRAEDELAGKFASMGLVAGETLLRLDSDEMRSARDYYSALSRFASGRVRVLVGTQMLAKGLDYPNVRLVGVIDADTSLNIPDFRSAERTFQLVSQVAGRAGRGAASGRVIIQTMRPEEPAIVLAARHDYLAFAGLELGARASFGLPPATRMARVVCRDEVAEKARSAGAALAERFALDGGVRVRGPLPCAVSKVAGHYRFVVEIIGRGAGEVQRALRSARSAGLLKSDSRTAVDVDPVAGL